MNSCFIILAAGESKRFNSTTPKLYHLYKGKALLMHSIDKAKSYNHFSKIVLVINKKHKKYIKKLKIRNIKIIEGGKTRAESSCRALKYILKFNIKNVMIHDAARPNFSLKLLDRLSKELKFNNCVIPSIKATDSVKQKISGKIVNLKRENIYLSQTPQAFKLKEIYKLQYNKSSEITDDAGLFIGAGKKIKIVKGEINNYKITFDTDIKINKTIKYGIGFDVHRLVYKKKLFLGGIKIPSPIGTLGHSDGDPVLHAVIDALLGASGLGNKGTHFPSHKKQLKNISSIIMLRRVATLLLDSGWKMVNLDATIIAQEPQVQPYLDHMRTKISQTLNSPMESISLKATTTDRLGFIGRGDGIGALAIVLIESL